MLSKWRLAATMSYFLPGGLVVPRRYRDWTVWLREGEGNEEMGECSKKKEFSVEKEKGRRGARRAVEKAFYAFLSSRGFVCNNLCGKTAWEMTTGSLCNLNLQQFTSGTFWEMAAGKIRGHGPHYVCGGLHEDIYRELTIDERKRRNRQVSARDPAF